MPRATRCRGQNAVPGGTEIPGFLLIADLCWEVCPVVSTLRCELQHMGLILFLRHCHLHARERERERKVIEIECIIKKVARTQKDVDSAKSLVKTPSQQSQEQIQKRSELCRQKKSFRMRTYRTGQGAAGP